MGFMKSVGRALLPVAGAAASFIPGVGPIASKLIGMGSGMAASALGASGRQGSQDSQGNWNQTGNTTQDTTGQVDSNQTGNSTFNRQEQGSQNILEDPAGAAFRRSLIPQMARMNQAAEEPVYGEAEKAGFLTGLNDLTKDAMTNLRSNLAASGRMDSGSLAMGAGDIEMGRLGEVAKYNQQIPLANRQYRDQARTQAMSLSQGLVPLMRLGQTNTGSSSGGENSSMVGSQTSTGRTTGTSQQNGTSNNNTNVNGPGFLQSLAGQFGGMMGDAMGGSQNPLNALFRNRTPNSQVGNLPIAGNNNPWLQAGAPWGNVRF